MKTTISNIVLFIFVCGLFNLALANDSVVKTKGDLPTIPNWEYVDKSAPKEAGLNSGISYQGCTDKTAVKESCLNSKAKIAQVSKK